MLDLNAVAKSSILPAVDTTALCLHNFLQIRMGAQPCANKGTVQKNYNVRDAARLEHLR